MNKPIKLVDRDYIILKEIYRWRVCLGRHIEKLVGFTSRGVCERRLKKLINMGYIERKHILYGVPGLYFLTHKGRVLINVSHRAEKIRIEQILHDIEVLDVAIFFMCYKSVTASQITTDKELHIKDGFGTRAHRPDFVITNGEKTMCIEIELTPKSKVRTEKILKENYLNYDKQVWVVPHLKHKVVTMLAGFENKYPNMKIISLEVIKQSSQS